MVNLAEKLAKIDDHWHPRLVGELNGQHVRLVKIEGEFVWHSHEREDEMFLVIQGEFEMHLRDRTITLHEGEFFIVPRGVEHRPVAKSECAILLFEPATTVNTGNATDARTRTETEPI